MYPPRTSPVRAQGKCSGWLSRPSIRDPSAAMASPLHSWLSSGEYSTVRFTTTPPRVASHESFLESAVTKSPESSIPSRTPAISSPSSTEAAEETRTTMQSSAVRRGYATSTTGRDWEIEHESPFSLYHEAAARKRSQTEQEEEKSPRSDYVLVDSDPNSGIFHAGYTDWELDDHYDGQRIPTDCEPQTFEQLVTYKSATDGAQRCSASHCRNLTSPVSSKQIETGNSQVRHGENALPCWAINEEVRHCQDCVGIIKWLSHTDPSSNHNFASRKRLGSTCSWILSTPQYVDWLSTSNSMLWLHGIPGSGKTVLTSVIIDDLRGRKDERGGTSIAYFYVASDSVQKQTRNLLCSIIAQLASKLTYIPESLCSIHGQYQSSQPPLHHLKQVLLSILQLDLETFIIIDALDEYTRGSEREEILAILEEFNSWSLANLHILATSRWEPDIGNVLLNLSTSTVCIQTPEHDADIVRYIKHELATRPRLARMSQEIKSEIESQLVRKASGMFLWAALQVETLEGCMNIAGIRAALNSIPKTLSETYARIILGIEKNYHKEAYRALIWLLFSERDLRIEELAETVALDPSEDPQFDLQKRLFNPHDVLHMLSSLVYITQSSGRDEYGSSKNSLDATMVKLVHHSVKEFLVSGQIQQHRPRTTFNFTTLLANDFIAESCAVIIIRYSRAEKTTLSEDVERFPLLEYACRHWYSHAQVTLGKIEKSQSSPTHRLMLSTAAFLTWLQIYRPDYPSETPVKDMGSNGSPLYYAAYLGFFDIAKAILASGTEVNARGGYYNAPLQATSLKGYESIVKLLLECGADPNAQGGHYGNALQAASVKGHESVVRLLLDYGADPNAQGGHYGNALIGASRGGNASVVSCLIQYGANIAARGSYGRTVLQRIADGGAEIRVENFAIQPPWEDATEESYPLYKSSEAELRTQNMATALHIAAAYKQVAAAQRLLLHGLSCTAEDSQKWTPLHWAAESGTNGIIGLLLESGAKIDTKESEGRSPLSWAAGCGHEATLKLLLGYGAEIHSEDVEGQTPLSWAAARGHSAIVVLLLKLGAAIESKDAEGQTALSWAAWNGHRAVVELLLYHGADVDSTDSRGRTPLLWATEGGYDAVVELLLAVQANINVRDETDTTPLSMAIKHGHKALVQLLLDAGANPAHTDTLDR